MTTTVHNYRKKRDWRAVAPLLPACLLPLALMGVSVRPALDYGALSARLGAARQRALEASEISAFLGGFGPAGPPTEHYRRMDAALLRRLPASFEATEFYEAALSAARGLDLSLEAIVPNEGVDLRRPVAHQSLYERRATLKGRARAEILPAFLAALHREGHPVCVHGCKLNALEMEPGVFDFHLDLGVYFAATPAENPAEFEDDSSDDQ